MGIDETLDGLIREENASSEAVKSLINVKDRKKGDFGSDVELKTDLDKNQVCIHTAVDMINTVLEMPKTDFKNKCILGQLTNLKERKLLSLDRKSRTEIVQIAKQPDVENTDQKAENFVKKFFTPRR